MTENSVEDRGELREVDRPVGAQAGSNNGAHPAVSVAKEHAKRDEPVTLSTGYRAFIRPVSATLILEVSGKIEDPPVPRVWNKEREEEMENPDDPSYLKAVEKADAERSMAGMDAMVLFGVELVDPLPEGDRWLKKLQYMERRGMLDLSKFDLTDPIDKEFLFLRYIAVAGEDLALISGRSGMNPAEVDTAVKNFPGNA